MTHTAADLHRRFPVGAIIQLEPLPGAVVYALVTGHSYDGLEVIEATDHGLEPGEVEAFMVTPEGVQRVFTTLWLGHMPRPVRELSLARKQLVRDGVL
jgi:hypothetical protein